MQRERTRPQQDDDLPQSSDDAVYDDVDWQEGEREAEEDIRADRVKVFDSAEDLIRDLEE